LERLGWLPELTDEPGDFRITCLSCGSTIRQDEARANGRCARCTPVDADPQVTECLWCRGCGKVENTVELRYDICRECGGSGVRQDHRLHDAPTVPMVAAAA
jgi:hypothetical protein